MRLRFPFAAFLLALSCCFVSNRPGWAMPSMDYVLITATATEIEEISLQEARRLLTGRRSSWPNGKRVTLVWTPKGSASMKWLAELVGTPEEGHRSFVLGRVFRGKLRKPTAVRSARAAVALVRASKGAIAAVPRSLVGTGVVALAITE